MAESWQQYWANEGQQRNQDMLDALRARDGAYDQAKLARLRAEEAARAIGTGIGAEYNPILGKPMVRDALGGTNTADQNIGGNIASGTPVQIMGRGAGIVADAKQSRAAGDQLSTGNQLDRTGSGFSSSSSFSPVPGGGGGTPDSDGEDAWIPEADGSCTLRNYPVGKVPANSFKTRADCREAQDNSYNCAGGKCEKASAGTAGRYKSLSECEAALIPAGFTGGQCAGVKYVVTGQVVGYATNGGTWGAGNIVPVGGFQITGLGPIQWAQTYDQQHANTGGAGGWYFAVRFADVLRQDFGVLIPRAFSGSSVRPTVTNIQVTVAPDSLVQEPPGGCGNPPKICPA
jgi:hypothetical protein